MTIRRNPHRNARPVFSCDTNQITTRSNKSNQTNPSKQSDPKSGKKTVDYRIEILESFWHNDPILHIIHIIHDNQNW